MDEITSIAESLKQHGFTEEEIQSVVPQEEVVEENATSEETPVEELPSEEKPVEEQPAPDSDKVSKHVPYDRFKEVNEKNKVLAAKLAAYEAQQAKAPTPVQPNPAPAAPVVSPVEAKAKYFAMLTETADKEAREIVGLTAEDDISTLQFTDYRKYQTYLNAMTSIVQEKDQENRQSWKTQAENTEFIGKLQSDPLFQQVYAYTVAEFDELPAKQSKKVTEALNRIGSKQGSKDDFRLVEDTFADYKNKFLALNGQAPSPTQQQPVVHSALDKTAGLPRAQGLSGAKTAAMSWAQVEQLIIDGRIDEIPKEMIKKIDPKLLE